jgi:hypothetical protein
MTLCAPPGDAVRFAQFSDKGQILDPNLYFTLVRGLQVAGHASKLQDTELQISRPFVSPREESLNPV